MDKSQIRVGGEYTVIVNRRVTRVRVDRIRVSDRFIKNPGQPRYDCTVVASGAQVEIRDAGKFQSELQPEAPNVTVETVTLTPDDTARMLGYSGREEAVNDFTMRDYPASDSAPPQESSDEAIEAVVKEHDAEESAEADPMLDVSASTTSTSEEDKQSSDPTAVTVVQNAEVSGSAVTSVAALAARLGNVHTRAPGTPIAGMVPNHEQEAILCLSEETQRTGQRVMVISAGAGTGKTATLKMLEQVLRGRGQYTAFNRSLVDDAKPKFQKANCRTTHQLAFHAVGVRYAHRLGGERMRSGHVAKLLELDPLVLQMAGEVDSQGLPRTKVLSAEMLAGQVLVGVRKFCQSADRCVTRKHLKWIDGIDPIVGGKVGRENQEIVREYLEPYLQKAWEDICSKEGRLSFHHDCYVKMWQLGEGLDRPVIAADYILLDEAQDTAPVFLDIIQQQSHALVIMVGDENQQIYEWRGAVNAMAAFQGAPRRVLSQSYRFGQVIADVANTILSELDEPTDLVMRGMPGMPSRVADLEQADCYLYRTNAGAVGRVMVSLKDGLRPHLVGGGADVVSWCQAAVDLQAGRRTSHPDLACFESWGEVEEYSKTDEGQEIRLMVKLIKEFGAEEIRDALRDMPAEKDADLVCCTAHKSKGREWDTVKLGPDFPVANKMQDSDRRLLYVAATRAKLTLDVSECPPFIGGTGPIDTGNPETSGAWVPGIEVEYTVPMPSAEDQAEWMVRKTCEAINQKKVGTLDRVTPTTAVEVKTTTSAATSQGKFTWTKYADKWCARGPAGRAVGSAIVVESRDGRQQDATIREVVKQYADAWIYRI